jgi:hypothetical protein
MSEEFLHLIWQYKFYKPGLYYTSNGQQMEVVHPGLPNSDAGPDFFNAKVKLDGVLWAGNVEIHHKASDWARHNHHVDPKYDNVVLHVVVDNDDEVFSTVGRRIPAWEMQVPETAQQGYHQLHGHKGWIACERQINQLSGFEIMSWIERMLVEKLERKVEGIESLLNSYQNDWQEVFYVVLARNFGFGLNGEPFEWLARQTPWKIIGRNADEPEKLDALFLGQAGFLQGLIYDDEYLMHLHKEYSVLKQKYSLEPLPEHVWSFLRLRPVNFPTIRLVQFAALISKNCNLFDALLNSKSVNEARGLLQAEPSPYWQTHYRLGAEGRKGSKKIGRQAIDLIIINTVTPLFFAYGKLRGKPLLQQKALDWLGELPPENNSIVKKWTKQHVELQAVSAADSQGMVFLKKIYCDHRKCLSCRVGHKLLTRGVVK